MPVNSAESGTATDLTDASPSAAGTAVSIEAVASTGYLFVSWTAPVDGFADSNAAETTFTMPTQSITITANCSPGMVAAGSSHTVGLKSNDTVVIAGARASDVRGWDLIVDSNGELGRALSRTNSNRSQARKPKGSDGAPLSFFLVAGGGA
jgi:hypothetical protein